MFPICTYGWVVNAFGLLGILPITNQRSDSLLDINSPNYDDHLQNCISFLGQMPSAFTCTNFPNVHNKKLPKKRMLIDKSIQLFKWPITKMKMILVILTMVGFYR